MSQSRGEPTRRVGRRIRPFFVSIALLVTVGDARADEPRVALALNWIRLPGAEDCIDSAELARTVEQQLGRSVFVSPTVATRVIEGWSEPARPGWRVVLRASDAEGNASGERELASTSETCSSLNRSIVLAITLLAQAAPGIPYDPPERALPAPAPQSTPAPPPQGVLADARAVRAADVVLRPTVGPSPLGRFEVGPIFGLGWGTLPHTAMSAGARAAIALGAAWMAEISWTYWFPQTKGTDGAITFSRTDFGLGLCRAFVEGPEMRISGCGGMQSNSIGASGLVSPYSELPHFLGYGRIVGLYGLTRAVWFTAAPGIGVPLATTTYNGIPRTPASSMESWTMPPIVGSLELSATFHFDP